jgi:hypothetical protein
MNSSWIFIILITVTILAFIITLVIYFSLQKQCTSYGDRTSCFEIKQSDVVNNGTKYKVIVKNKDEIGDKNKIYNLECTLKHDANANLPNYFGFRIYSMKPSYFTYKTGELIFVFETTFTDFEFIMYPNVRSLKLSKISVIKDPVGDKAFYKYSTQYNMFTLEKKSPDCVVFPEEPRACFFINVEKTSEYINDASLVTIGSRYVHNYIYNWTRRLFICICTFNPSELPQYENIEFSPSGSKPASFTLDRNKGIVKCVFENIRNSGTFAFIVEPYLPSFKVTSIYFENKSQNEISNSLLQQDVMEEYM